MVAWRLTMCTPEYPDGRDIIVIANDLTYLVGSFGPREDHVFNLASKRARELKIPRLYISANSGARIGLANEIKSVFKIAWEDPEEQDKVYSKINAIDILLNLKIFFFSIIFHFLKFFLGFQVHLSHS